MGFFDFIRGGDDFDRRERRRAKEEAEDYRREARNTLSDAKDLYEDYKELKGDTRRLMNELDSLVRSHNRYKVDLLKELGGEIAGTIENFKRFNVNSRISSAPDVSGDFNSALSGMSTSSFMSGIMSTPVLNLNPISLVLSALSDPYKDRDKAADQYYAANDYLNSVQTALETLKSVYKSLKNTKTFIEDERVELDQLMKKIRALMPRLNDAMNKKSFTETEAKYINGICKIAELIKKTLETQLADNGGKIQSNYQKYSQKLHEINSFIPAQPVIENSSSWIGRILQIEVY